MKMLIQVALMSNGLVFEAEYYHDRWKKWKNNVYTYIKYLSIVW